MDYNNLTEIFNRLYDLLKDKKQSIIKKEIERLNKIDEEILIISETINKDELKQCLNSLDDKQKAEIKDLVQKIKKTENDNEILIKHSLDVINGLLSGILNISNKENNSYNSKGMNCQNDNTYNISSITEEA